MKTKNKFYAIAMLMIVLFSISPSAYAQFTFNGQMVDRFELRHGYGKAIEKGTDPAAFISQRIRLEGNYKLNKLTFYVSFQDVRTWGSTAQLKITDNLFSLYEGWAQIHFDSSFSIKVGRQELNYDNARFLGNVDWALQGRSHDFALLKYEKKNTKIDLGGGYNQDAESLTNNIFTNTNQYKTAQMLRIAQKLGKFDISFLIWNNGQQFIVRDTAGKVTQKGMRYSQTFGLPTLKFTHKNTTISGFYYHQVGKDIKNKSLNAFDASLQVSQVFKFNEAKKNQLRLTAGAEVLSGTATNYTGSVNQSYSPLFGTNHGFNGYMDMFYVGGRHENSVGLIDAYLKLRYDFSPAAFIALNGNAFVAYADVYKGATKQNKYLGTELDLAGGYVFNKSVSFQAGYSHMFGTPTIQNLEKVNTADAVQNWAYVMLIIRPKSDKKFIGLYN